MCVTRFCVRLLDLAKCIYKVSVLAGFQLPEYNVAERTKHTHLLLM